MRTLKNYAVVSMLLILGLHSPDVLAGKHKGKEKQKASPPISEIHRANESSGSSALESSSSERSESQIRQDVRWMQSKREAAKFCSCALKLGLNCGAAWCFKDNAGAMIVLSGYVYNQIQTDLPYLFSKIVPASMSLSDRQKYQLILDQLEEDYEVRKMQLSEYNQQAIEKLIKENQEKIDNMGSRSNDPGFELNLGRLKTILSLPLNRAQPRDSSLAEEELERHLSTFSTGIRDELMKHRLQTQLLNPKEDLFSSPGESHSIRTSFMFIGQAGTGKTTTAEALAISEGRPFCKISVSKLKIDELTGKQQWNAIQLGAITRCFTQPDIGQPAINPYIFIDEIHDSIGSESDEAKRIYSFIKRLTDPDQMEIEDDALGIKLSLKEVTVVLGSNVDYDQLDDVANALQSRMVTIYFPNLTPAQKKSIAKSHFKTTCRIFGYLPNPNDLSMRDTIVNFDREPGARVLKKVLSDYIVHQIAVSQGKIKNLVFDLKQGFKKNGATSIE